MRRIIGRAWKDTFAFLGGWGLLAGLVAIPIVGFGLHYWSDGRDAMMGELQIWLIYGLAATVIVFLFIFLVNLIRAPLLLEREDHMKTIADKNALAGKVSLNRRSLTEEQKGFIADAIRTAGIKPKEINVIYYQSSDECADFAEDIADAIRSAEIPCKSHHGWAYEHNPRDRGVKIEYNNSKILGILAEKLHYAFKELGYLAERRVKESKNDHIHIYVARSSNFD